MKNAERTSRVQVKTLLLLFIFGDYLNPKLRSRIRSAIRKIWWMYSSDRKEALKRCKLARGFGWQCEKCKTATKKPEVDHIEPVGSGSWDGIIERMFCGADKLQVLCRECHKGKK